MLVVVGFCFLVTTLDVDGWGDRLPWSVTKGIFGIGIAILMSMLIMIIEGWIIALSGKVSGATAE